MTSVVASADVVIVGGGIIGLATAERLVARDLSVIVVDGLGVASGASGASGGLVRAFELTGGEPSWAATGLDIYLRRGWHGRWPEVREHGSLMLFGPDGVGRARSGLERLRAAGHSARVLGAEEAREAFPGLALPPDFVGVYEDRAGWLPAREVALAMLRDAGPGVTVLPVPATAVLTTGSRVRGVRTTAGSVAAPAVLLAAGAGSSDLARTAGVDLPLRNRSVSYCVFQPRGAQPGDLPAVIDTTTGAWLRRWGSGPAVLAGVRSAECGVPSTVTALVPVAEQCRIRTVVQRRFPCLADADVLGGVTAHDAMAPDAEGAVIAWPEPAGLVTATGWNGGGFKVAPALGDYTAARIREVLG